MVGSVQGGGGGGGSVCGGSVMDHVVHLTCKVFMPRLANPVAVYGRLHKFSHAAINSS